MVGQCYVFVFFGNIAHAQVYVGEISLRCKRLEMLDLFHAENFFGKPHHRAAANTCTAKVFGILSAPRVYDGCTRAHADHDRLTKMRKIQTAKANAFEFGHRGAGKLVDRLGKIGRAHTRGQDLLNVRKGKPVLIDKFSKCAIYRRDRICRLYEQRRDQFLLFSILAKANDLGRAPANVNADHNTHV